MDNVIFSIEDKDILKIKATLDSNYIVLARWNKTKPEFVTWLYNPDSKCFILGHYFMDYEKALEDFEVRN